jgi:hypothetical protein
MVEKRWEEADVYGKQAWASDTSCREGPAWEHWLIY